MKKITLTLVSLAALLVCAVPAYAVQNVSGDAAISADGGTNGTNFSGDFTLTVPSGTDVNSAANTNGITTATNNTGSVSFAGSSTVYGVVGTASTGLIRAFSVGTSQSSGSSVILNGAANITTTTIHAGTLTLNGNLTGTTVNFASPTDGQLQLGNGVTLNAAVTTDTTNKGSILALGNATFAGQIGTSTASVSTVSGGYSTRTVTFSSDVFAVNTNVTGSGTLALNGNLTGTTLNMNSDGWVKLAADKNITAAITTSSNNSGTVQYLGNTNITAAVGSVAGNDIKQVFVDGGIVTLNSGTDYAVQTTTVRTNTATGTTGTMKLGQNSTVTGSVNVNGTGVFDASSFQATTTDDFELASGTTLRTTVSTTSGTSTTAGLVHAATAANDAQVRAGSLLDVNVTASYVSNGTVFMLVDGNVGGTGVAAPGTTTDNSATLSFTPTVQNNDLVMTVTRANLGTLGTDTNSKAVGATLNGFTSGATGDIATVIANLDTLSSVQSYTSAVNQLDADMNGGVNAASFNSTGGALNTVNTRLGNARNGRVAGGGQNGLSSGDEFTDAAIWGQGFGAYGDQDDKDGVAGFTSSTWGTAAGLDWKTSEAIRLGLSFAFSQSNVDTNGDVSSVDVNGYQGTLYGSYDGEPWYVDAMFAFGWNTYSGSRNIVFASINRAADQDYDGQQYSTKFTFGYPIAIADKWDLVPVASLFYSHLSLDGFTETGANSLNLIVADQNYDFLQQGLGGKIVGNLMDDSKQRWVPEVHALWLYDYIGDQAKSTATFTAGGNSFSTNGLDPEQSSFNLGAGLTVYPTEVLSFNVSYDFEGRSDYTGHGGTATVRYEF